MPCPRPPWRGCECETRSARLHKTAGAAPMQDLACSGFHGHVGGRFRRICTGTTRSLRSARLGDRKGRARKDAIFNAKKAARQAGAACCHSVDGRRLDQSSTRPTYRLSCGCSTTNASSRRMNARGHGRQVGLAPFTLNETRVRPDPRTSSLGRSWR